MVDTCRYKYALLAYKYSQFQTRWLASRTTEAGDTLLRNLPEHLRSLTKFAFATGLRRANVLKLKWSQVDMARQVMSVAARNIKRRKTLGIPLNATAMEILRGQIGRHDEYVFVYNGKPLNATVNTAWRNALKKSGIEDFRFHDTRHTWASLLIQNGVPKGMVKEMGGWKSDSMVERYAHLDARRRLLRGFMRCALWDRMVDAHRSALARQSP